MGKILSSLLILLIIGLVGCSSNVKIHKSIDEDFARESLKIAETVMKQHEKGIKYRDDNKENRDMYEEYQDNYINAEFEDILNDVEVDISIFTINILTSYKVNNIEDIDVSDEDTSKIMQKDKKILDQLISKGVTFKELEEE